MDSSYFLISSNTSTNSSNIINNDLEQSSSFNYDSFDGFSFLDQQGLRLYDYFGTGGGGGGGRNSPFINQCPLDQLDLHHQQKSFPFQTDPNQEPDDDLQETLTSFVGELGVDNETGYNPAVDLFATNTTLDFSDSTEAYYLRLALEQNSNMNACNYNNNINNNNFSDINNNHNYCSNNINNGCFSYTNCIGDSNTNKTAKRSVLMNLLIDGSDVGAGYTSHNCRALPQRLSQQHQQTTTTTNNS